VPLEESAKEATRKEIEKAVGEVKEAEKWWHQVE